MKYITQYDFADMMSVHVMTVRRWIKKGLPHIKVANAVRINPDEAIDWLKNNGGK